MSLSLFIKILNSILKTRLEYRADFLLGIFAQIIGYGANYLVIWMLLTRFNTINGWKWPEIALLMSINLLTYAVGASFTYTPMTMLEQLILKGELDKYLTKPLNPFIYLCTNLFNFGYVAHFIISVVIFLWSVTQLTIEWTSIKIIYLSISVISASFIQAGCLVLIGSWAFFALRSQFLFNLFFKVREFISYPIPVYSVIIQIFLTCVLPLAFINYYPSVFLLDFKSNIQSWLVPFIGPIFFFVAYKIWCVGINRYQGTGN